MTIPHTSTNKAKYFLRVIRFSQEQGAANSARENFALRTHYVSGWAQQSHALEKKMVLYHVQH